MIKEISFIFIPQFLSLYPTPKLYSALQPPPAMASAISCLFSTLFIFFRIVLYVGIDLLSFLLFYSSNKKTFMKINTENNNSNMIKLEVLSFIHLLVMPEGTSGRPWSIGVWE